MTGSQWFFRHVVYRAALTITGQSSLYARRSLLEQQQFWSVERLNRYRDTRLREILSLACSRVPFYEKLPLGICSADIRDASRSELHDLLSQFPVVSKRALRRGTDAFRPNDVHGRILRKTTGGSTGEPVTVFKNAGAVAQERAAMWLAYGWFDVEVGNRCMRFWGTPHSRRRKWGARLADLAMNRRRASSFAFSEVDLEEYWKTLKRFAPHYLHGYASMLVQMAEFGEENHLSPPAGLKAVVATAEVLSESDKSRLEKVFAAPVQIEYGCGEVGPIAYSCEQEGLHHLATNVHIEIVDDSGVPSTSGSLLITDLHNTAMPLIRYEVGDLASWGGTCSCGRTLPLLEGVHGRAYDIVIAPTGERFHGEFFMYLFEDIERKGGSIDQFQVVQTSQAELTVRVVSTTSHWSEQEHLISKKFARSLPAFSITIERVTSIDRLPSGKMQVVSNQAFGE